VDKDESYLKDFNPLTAEGPPCPRCGAECELKPRARGIRASFVWKCPKKPTEHGVMRLSQGKDILERLRHQHADRVAAENEVMIQEFDQDDMGAIGEILAEL